MEKFPLGERIPGILLGMVLRLDPRFPVVWQDPRTLQIGIDEPVVFEGVSRSEELAIELLRRGAPAPAFALLAEEAGNRPAATRAILDRVDGMLRSDAPPQSSRRVTIAGGGRAAELLSTALRESGLVVRDAGTDLDQARAPADLAVAFCHFAPAPVLHGLWLRQDIPHLAVVLGDRFTTIGPLVEPGTGPCLYCIHRYRSDRQKAWPVIASQLHGRFAGTETPVTALQCASVVALLVLRRLDGDETMPGIGTQYGIDVGNGTVSQRTIPRHPDCLCGDEVAGVSELVSSVERALKGTGTGNGHPGPSQPTTAEGASVPA